MPVPVPHEDSKAYSTTRLQESLSFASQALEHRDISPRTERIYRRFQVEINAALLATSKEERLKRIGRVMAFEKLFAEKYYLQPQNFGQGANVRADLLALREMQYLARYGVHMQIITSDLRNYISSNKTPGWETSSSHHRWTAISQRLKDEEETFRKWLEGSNNSFADHVYPIFRAIQSACESMGYDFENVRWSIHNYAKRKHTFHKDLDDSISEGKFNTMAQALYADLCEVSCVFFKVMSRSDCLKLSGLN